jgi:hypothetical protein
MDTVRIPEREGATFLNSSCKGTEICKYLKLTFFNCTIIIYLFST